MGRSRLATLASAVTLAAALGGGVARGAGPAIGLGAPVQVSTSGGEPNIAINSLTGEIFASNVGGQTWRSADRGATWTRKTNFSAALCCGDFDTAIDAAGSLYGAGLGELVYTAVAKSNDGATTWSSSSPTAPEEDRPWIAAGAANELYLSYHDLATQLIYIEKSTDGGRNWTRAVPAPVPDIAGGADAAVFSYGDTLNGNLHRGVDGYLYTAWTASNPAQNATHPPYSGPLDRIFVSVVAPSTLPAITVQSHVVYEPAATATATSLLTTPSSIAGFPWVTTDNAGTVYVVWSGAMDGVNFNTYYAYSTDRAKTWSSPIVVHSGGTDVFATAAAGSDGIVDIAWYGANDIADPSSETGNWYVKVAQVQQAHSTPQVSDVASTPVMHKGNICQVGILCGVGNSGDRSLLDFFEIAIDSNGAANIAYADNGRCTNGCSAYLSYVRQTSGPSAYGGTVTG